MREAMVEGTPLKLRTELPRGEQLDAHLAEMFESTEWVPLFKAELKERGFEIRALPPIGTKREQWLADTHDRTDRCRPCGLNGEHCDVHGKRFTPGG